MSAYTDADVQAAAKAIARRSLNGESRWSDYSRAALDVVAPAIAARALREAADSVTGSDRIRAIPRSTLRNWLRDRADEIERTP